jgi:hypothetical protein
LVPRWWTAWWISIAPAPRSPDGLGDGLESHRPMRNIGRIGGGP